jgi:L-threonylcarbamoyladenylate synthase
MTVVPRVLPASPDSIEEAAERIRVGRLAAFPTETVYGLGGDATNDRAVAEIFAAKNRPCFNPLIVHLPDSAATRDLVEWTPLASRLAERFWPGPLTLVLRRAAGCPVSLLASAGLDTLALRVPAHPIARALLRAAGVPVCAPSANRSGRVSSTAAAHVAEEFAGTDLLVLDGGPCEVGLESTVLDVTGETPVLLRPGGVPVEEIGVRVDFPGAGPIRSPGMLESHYAPGLPVRLRATAAWPGEALLGFGPGEAPPGFAAVRWLSRTGNLVEAAANLFAGLRALDRPEFAGIAVMPIPEEGLGRAINDRLARAAAQRSFR